MDAWDGLSVAAEHPGDLARVDLPHAWDWHTAEAVIALGVSDKSVPDPGERKQSFVADETRDLPPTSEWDLERTEPHSLWNAERRREHPRGVTGAAIPGPRSPDRASASECQRAARATFRALVTDRGSRSEFGLPSGRERTDEGAAGERVWRPRVPRNE